MSSFFSRFLLVLALNFQAISAFVSGCHRSITLHSFMLSFSLILGRRVAKIKYASRLCVTFLAVQPLLEDGSCTPVHFPIIISLGFLDNNFPDLGYCSAT